MVIRTIDDRNLRQSTRINRLRPRFKTHVYHTSSRPYYTAEYHERDVFDDEAEKTDSKIAFIC